MDDERRVELDCIAAIFPEMAVDPATSFSVSLELPVGPQAPVRVAFTKASDPQPTSRQAESSQVNFESTNENASLRSLSYLPSLRLHITLPDGYPEVQPPKFRLSSTPLWLSRACLDELEAKGQVMWEEAGRSAIMFGYIDLLQQAAEDAFGFAGGNTILEVSRSLEVPMLDFDIQAKQAAFERETFDCGICLEPKKGTVCYRMLGCGHVFCVQCLRDFYNSAIKDGDLAAVRCLAPGCAKEREKAQSNDAGKKTKTQLSPSELLQVPLEVDVVTRYVRLRHKANLESDKNTIYCPRKWCQGAARSKKHRKPVGLTLNDASDDESDQEEKEPGKAPSNLDRLSVCEDCSFAFCNRCYHGWHGEFKICLPSMDGAELTAEEKASMEYLKRYTAPCPTCSAPAQKTYGCNHMICFTCRSHFCYLCSAWLPPANPYTHFNTKGTRCYMCLWELENGDGIEAEIEHAGGAEEAPEEAPEGVDEEAPEEVPEEAVEVVLEAPLPVAEEPPIVRETLQREGPLVLRINELPPRPAPAPAPAPAVRAPGRRRGGRFNREQPAQNGPQQARGLRVAVQNRPRQNAAERQPARQEPIPHEVGAAHQAWVQMFVQMALNDEEDQLESDDEGDGAWEIPVR